MGTALSVPLATTTRFHTQLPGWAGCSSAPPPQTWADQLTWLGRDQPELVLLLWEPGLCVSALGSPPPTMLKGLGKSEALFGLAPGPPASETRGCSLTCELHYPTGTVASSMALWCGEEVCPPAFSFSMELQGRQEPRLSAASLCLSSAGQVF